MIVRVRWGWFNKDLVATKGRNHLVINIHANNVQFDHEEGIVYIVTDRYLWKEPIKSVVRIIND